jgi:hypothetical protein
MKTNLTPEQRSALAKKANAAGMAKLTPGQRSLLPYPGDCRYAGSFVAYAEEHLKE